MYDWIDYSLAASFLAAPFIVTAAVSAVVSRRIARREFTRQFRHVVMIRGNGGKFERL